MRHESIVESDACANLVNAPNRSFLVYASDDGPAEGCVALIHLDEMTAMIARLYVWPTLRGTGAGRMLMQHAIDYARSVGYRRVALDTDADALRPAYLLYVSLGFRACEAFAPVTYSNVTYMELELASSRL